MAQQTSYQRPPLGNCRQTSRRVQRRVLGPNKAIRTCQRAQAKRIISREGGQSQREKNLTFFDPNQHMKTQKIHVFLFMAGVLK